MPRLTRFARLFGQGAATAISYGMYGFVALVVLLAIIFNYYANDLPDYNQLAKYEPPVTTRLYASDGKLLAEYAKERRIFTPIEAMPKQLIQAFIAAEDKNFYQHKGVDLFGIVRAAMANIRNYGSGQSLVGGSTITQQVVKNFLLTNEKSFERKIKEAILAHRISKVFSKQRIMELYLNEIFLGMRSYGVAAAGLNFFNKSLTELTIEEAALLAAMPKAPSAFSPDKNYNRALERRNYVISRMFDDGYIDAQERDRAIKQPIILQHGKRLSTVSGGFYAEDVRRILANQFGESSLYQGGLTVKTALDPELQEKAETALRSALIDYDRRHGYRGPVASFPTTAEWGVQLSELRRNRPNLALHGEERLALVLGVSQDEAIIGFEGGGRAKMALSGVKWARKKISDTRLGVPIKAVSDVLKKGDAIIVLREEEQDGFYALQQIPEINGAMVAMDPHSGQVRAMVGGYSYGATEFNRATQARRQPGSAFKPFVFLAALESGFSPSTVVQDIPIELEQGAGLPLWRPQNYDGKFLGPTTLRVGLEKSRNTMTVQLAQMVGLARVLDMGERFGIYKKLPRNYSAVLGSHETTLMRIANAYSMLVNGGYHVDPSLVESITDRYGRVLYRADTRECQGCNEGNNTLNPNEPPLLADDREQVVDGRVAYQMISMLEGVVQRGTATHAKIVGKPLAGKTGTTNESRDTWFIGFAPDLVAGVYIGFDTPRNLGAKETGGRVALPAFTEFMEAALEKTPATPFRIPPGIRQINVDRTTGLPPFPGQEDTRIITEAFLVGDPIFIPEAWRAKIIASEREQLNFPQIQPSTAEYDEEGFNPFEDPSSSEWRDVGTLNKQSINATPTQQFEPNPILSTSPQRRQAPAGNIFSTRPTLPAPPPEPVNPFAQRRNAPVQQEGFDNERNRFQGGTGGIY